MPMSPYPVMCYAPGCSQPAAFKIASLWNDGVTEELKTYSLACPDCLADRFEDAIQRRAACLLAPGESLAAPGIYELHRGDRDKTLKRCPAFEVKPVTS